MAIKGSLREAGLADVCQLLALGQKTGCLSVTDRSRFGQIYFDGGRITFATIVNRRDRLGDVLVRGGEISPDQLQEGLDAQARQPERRLGELLLERGAIDRDTLTRAIQKQIEEAIFYLFTWSQGNFYFEADKAPDRGELLISVNPEMLLLEGARRVDEWSVIEQRVPSMDLVFQLERDRLAAAAVDLTPAQERLVGQIDGHRTVTELAEATGLVEFETAKAMFGLAQAGFVTRAGQRQDAATADVDETRNLGRAFFRTDMLDDSEREFRRVLRAEPDDLTARHYLSLIALRRRHLDEAVRGLAAILDREGARVGLMLNLAYALRLQQRHDQAALMLERARQVAPDDPRVRLAEGANHLFAGRTDPATAALDAYRGLTDPDAQHPARFYYCVGLAALVDGRMPAADGAVQDGLRAHPGSAPLHILAGNLAERRGLMDDAERAYQRAAEEDPGLAQAHRNLGDLQYRRGAVREAMEHYERAAEIDPDMGDELYTRLAELHYRQGQREEAVRCWSRAIEINPDNEVARNRLEVVGRAGA